MLTKAEIGRRLDRSHTTIKNWERQYSRFFSGERHYTQEDIEVFATINALLLEGIGHDAVEVKLDEGYRVSLVGANLIPVSEAKQVIDASALRKELDYMRQLYEQEKTAHDETRQRLTDEIRRLERELGRLEGRLGE
ncbi:MAG: MerR family transcriptional regulator [Anaerolineae bacterium]|nr:MerR family transcriptional regulator [Anaerolineae bacterium]